MSDCPVCVGIPGYEYHTCGQANDCDEELIVKSCRRLKDEDNKKYTEAEHQEIVEKIVQEKLRQQRIASYENVLLKLTSLEFDAIPYRIHERIKELVLNAKID